MSTEGEDAASLRAVPALEVQNLGKTFPGQRALFDVDLTVAPGEVHALLGENGSGKSTFIKILSGYHKPDEGGAVLLAGDLVPPGDPGGAYAHGARFVHQDLGLVDSLSIADNLFLGSGFPTKRGTIRRRDLFRDAKKALTVADLDLDPGALVSSLTPALKTGVAVARALGADPTADVKLLVMDEPTATLPDHEVSQLLAIVRAVAARGVAVVYVTHRIDEIFEIADMVTVLRDGRKVATVSVAGLAHQKLIALLVDDEFSKAHAVSEAVRSVAGQVVLRVDGLVSGPLDGVNFDSRAREVVGIAGITGSGRDVLLASVFGAIGRESGDVVVDGRSLPAHNAQRSVEAGIAYIPAERKILGAMLDLTARENLTVVNLRPFWNRLFLRRSKEVAEVNSWFGRLSVRPETGAELPFGFFSGGNQQKIVLAKWLRCRPSLLLLDEPTQGVDIAAKAEIHLQLIKAAYEGASVVLSSSDAEELIAVCHRVLVVRRGRIVSSLTGTELTVANISRDSLGIGKEAA